MSVSYETYHNLGFNELSLKEFKAEIATAQTLIEMITHYFYLQNNLNDDLNSSDAFIKQRAMLYQKAICMQAEFGNAYGSTPVAQADNTVSSVHIGNTSISYNNAKTNNATYGNSGVALIVYNLLFPTGLLYAGANVQNVQF